MASSSPEGSPAGRTQSPARSLRTRMGTAMRRASSGLAFGKAGTLSRSESKSSLRSVKVDTATPPADAPSVPSPVIESPAGERAAEEAGPSQPIGPSPLVQITSAPSETPSQASSAAQPTPAAPESGPTPAPAADMNAEPANAPQQTSAPEPVTIAPSASAPSVSAPEPADAPEEEDEASQDIPAVDIPRVESPEAESRAASPPQAPAEIPTIPDPELARSPSRDPLALAAEGDPLALAAEGRRADYFSWTDEQALAPKWSSSDIRAANAEPPAEADPAGPHVSTPETAHVAVDHAQAFAWHDDGIPSKKTSSGSVATSSRRGRSVSPIPAASGRLSTRTSRSSVGTSSYGHVISSGSRRPSVTFEPEAARRGRSSSVRMQAEAPYDDPFVDPPSEKALKKSLSPIESVREPMTARSEAAPEFPTPAPSSFPLPPVHEVIGVSSGNGPTMAVGYNLDGAMYDDRLQHETDERLPLLQRAGSPGKNKAPYQDLANATVAFPSVEQSSTPVAIYSLDRLGWVECALPDSSVYYYHAGLRVTTDLDLRNSKKLRAVTEYLDRKASDALGLPPAGWELWLRDAGLSRGDFVTQRCYVNHRLRVVSIQGPQTPTGEMSLAELSDDDKFDMEYRYWSFIEAHPAHTPLPAEVRREAVDALTWCYTDCLLPTQNPVAPPFTPQECQELMGLLKSPNVELSASLVQARIVARVLLRQAQWRQRYFRPNKPLPSDNVKGILRPTPPKPSFAQSLLHVFVSCLCLGIPYLFYDRSHHSSFDHESGVRSGGPMLMVGGCACLVAALILSASVTFISLPGLDDVARLAGLIAIIFSASSMVSAIISLFKYKADLERSVMYAGGEGLLVLSRRSIIMSLPLVFLAWAIAAFMTGITFYSFRGATLTDRVIIRHPFEDYTHWAVVGTMSGLAAMLLIFAILARR